MNDSIFLQRFTDAAVRAGAQLHAVSDEASAGDYIAQRANGIVLVPSSPLLERIGFAAALAEAGCVLADPSSRQEAPRAAAGVTGANFAIADTGTVVLESTTEAMRMATTLPERHFILLDPRKIVADGAAAVPWMRRIHQERPRAFLAWITGPSRTADIERVLTIGVHGPRELHLLLVEGLSDDFLEM